MKTYYDILSIPESAHSADIKSAYRRLAKQHHPDVNSSEGAHERFIAIEKAYSTLSDPIKRKHYDNGLDYLRNKRHSSKSYTTGARKDPRRHESTPESRKAAWLKHIERLMEDKAYYQKFVKYKWLSIALSLFLSILFFLDDFNSELSKEHFIAEIEFQYALTNDLSDADYYILSTADTSLRLHHRFVQNMKEGDVIMIEKTPMLNMIPSIWIGQLNTSLKKHVNPAYAMAKTIFSLLVLMSIGGMMNKARSEAMVNLTLLTGFVFLLCTLFLFLKLINY